MKGYCERVALAVGDGPGGVIVGVLEGVGVQVGVLVRVGNVGIAVGGFVALGVLLGRIVAVAGEGCGVQVACNGVPVGGALVGTAAMFATVGSIVGVAKAAAI